MSSAARALRGVAAPIALHRRPRPVDGSSSRRGAPEARSRQCASCASSTLALEPLPLPDGESPYCTGSSGRAMPRRRRRRRRARPDLAQEHAEATRRRRRCDAVRAASRCSPRQANQSSARKERPVARSNGRSGLLTCARETPRPPIGCPEWQVESSIGRSDSSSSRDHLHGLSRFVRETSSCRDSCRSMSTSRLGSTHRDVQRAGQSQAEAERCTRASRVELVEEPESLLGKREREA